MTKPIDKSMVEKSSDPHAGTELWIGDELVYRKGDPEFEKLSKEELGDRLEAAFDKALAEARKRLNLD